MRSFGGFGRLWELFGRMKMIMMKTKSSNVKVYNKNGHSKLEKARKITKIYTHIGARFSMCME